MPIGATLVHSGDPTVTALVDVIHGVVIRPGDTLVVAAPDLHSLGQANQMRSDLEKYLPGTKVVILAASQLAVYRPE